MMEQTVYASKRLVVVLIPECTRPRNNSHFLTSPSSQFWILSSHFFLQEKGQIELWQKLGTTGKGMNEQEKKTEIIK